MDTRLSPRFSTAQAIALYGTAVLVLLLSMHYRLGLEMADDAAFFLRYAENMLKGEFWVWNPGEAPVWGASAPLYPLLIAAAMELGLSPETAIVAVGLALASVSLAAVALMLGHRFGVMAGIAFVTFSALDTDVMYFSGAGLEAPLTFALLALALWTVLFPPRPWVVGLVGGLLMVNKLDLVPVGGLLLLAHWFQDRRFPRVAVGVAGAMALAWYGFAWWHFGAPLPNSFLTKSLHQNDHPRYIGWTWFSGLVYGFGLRRWLTGLSFLAALRYGRSLLPALTLLGGTLAVHTIAYTIKYPFEPYNWYAMPGVFGLLAGGAVGVALIAEQGSRWIPGKPWASPLIAIVVLAVTSYTTIHAEVVATANLKLFTSYHEFDRAEAGRWVSSNTPENFVVYTMWGNPAYHSRRKVLDGSFLNRRFEETDLIKKYRPEILILQNNPGSTPIAPVFAMTKGEGYRIVKIFDKTHAAGMDYFFAVLAREDVLDQISNIEVPLDLMRFVRDVHLGNEFGILKPQGLDTLFVHPGMTEATTFQFDTPGYLRDAGRSVVSINARMAPNIPEDAVQRGAGNVRVRIMQGAEPMVDEVVKVGKSMNRSLSLIKGKPLRFAVDNNGGPDSDWLLLSIR
jgi:hypothetical protein